MDFAAGISVGAESGNAADIAKPREYQGGGCGVGRRTKTAAAPVAMTPAATAQATAVRSRWRRCGGSGRRSTGTDGSVAGGAGAGTAATRAPASGASDATRGEAAAPERAAAVIATLGICAAETGVAAPPESRSPDPRSRALWPPWSGAVWSRPAQRRSEQVRSGSAGSGVGGPIPCVRHWINGGPMRRCSGHPTTAGSLHRTALPRDRRCRLIRHHPRRHPAPDPSPRHGPRSRAAGRAMRGTRPRSCPHRCFRPRRAPRFRRPARSSSARRTRAQASN